jgi:tetrahedral aminopeptidase
MPELNINVLKRLCETPGIAGREDAVRSLVREELAGLVDEVQTDPLGNLIGIRRGKGGPRVMMAAHMDEIGFMVKHIDERGFIRIHPVGGFDPSRLPAQRVTVHAHDGTTWTGSIGVAGKPIHLQAASEVKPPAIDDLFVDIGLDGETARATIDIGDMITLERSLVRTGPQIVSKALDDRVGMFIMLETLRGLGATNAEVIAVATVQEEVGVRGATTAAFALQPDIGIALDITPAGDFPGAPEEHVGVSLGNGVALKVMDPGAISDHSLNQQLRRIAADHDIPYQLEILGRGGTDASAIQRARAGVRATALSIPVRYAHTVNETCAVADVEAAIALLTRYIESE